MATRRTAPKPPRKSPVKPRQILFALFLALCLVGAGWRVLRPVLWPHLHPMGVKQTSNRMYDDNTYFR